jgi:amino acid transporter
MHGLLAALIASAMLAVIIYFSMREIPELLTLQDYNLFLSLFAVVIFLGVCITWVSNFSAVNKYLKAKADELYH